jgi:pyridoxal phosphate-dependent aminotransferase EpsN
MRLLNWYVSLKKKIRQSYENGLRDLPVTFMQVFEKGEPNYWLTVVTFDEDCDVTPEDIITGLEKENIESRPVWKPMNMQPVFKDCLYFSEDDNYYLEQDLFRRGVCLPSGCELANSKHKMIVYSIRVRVLF